MVIVVLLILLEVRNKFVKLYLFFFNSYDRIDKTIYLKDCDIFRKGRFINI